MVDVYKRNANGDIPKKDGKAVQSGEIIFNDDGHFRLHSSDQVFDTKTYYYKTRL